MNIIDPGILGALYMERLKIQHQEHPRRQNNVSLDLQAER